ncbi:hypothetical protein [Nonomuraea maheshkhaliensis]
MSIGRREPREIALDHRGSGTAPRVVAGAFWTDPHQCAWRVVAPTFSALVAAMNLTGPPRPVGQNGPHDHHA